MSGSLRSVGKSNEGEPPPVADATATATRYDAALERRIAAMRAALARMRPGSDAEALRALRAAFPGSSLSERVAALSRRAPA